MKKLLPILILNLVISNLLNAQCPPNFVNSYQQFNFSGNLDVDLADLDGDGDIDAFVSGDQDNAANYDFVFLNNGEGYFQSNNQRLDQQMIYSSVLGDIDGDGDIDAITIRDFNQGYQLKTWKNFGNGTFGFNGQSSALNLENLSRDYLDLELIDLDLDGDLDLQINSRGKNGFYIFCNDGFGGFSNINNSSNTTNPYPVLSPTAISDSTNSSVFFMQRLDYNHDGLLDFLVEMMKVKVIIFF